MLRQGQLLDQAGRQAVSSRSLQKPAAVGTWRSPRTSADPRPPRERLLWALRLPAFYSIRLERLLMEQIDSELGIGPGSRPTVTDAVRSSFVSLADEIDGNPRFFSSLLTQIATAKVLQRRPQ